MRTRGIPLSIRVALSRDVMKKVSHVGIELGVGTAEAAARLIALAVKDYEPPGPGQGGRP